eukprot:m.75259 g.75259  ORF g.75259 m.75259 type:complete len:521 (+) comp24759_c0_seq1:133-1695(+)
MPLRSEGGLGQQRKLAASGQSLLNNADTQSQGSDWDSSDADEVQAPEQMTLIQDESDPESGSDSDDDEELPGLVRPPVRVQSGTPPSQVINARMLDDSTIVDSPQMQHLPHSPQQLGSPPDQSPVSLRAPTTDVMSNFTNTNVRHSPIASQQPIEPQQPSSPLEQQPQPPLDHDHTQAHSQQLAPSWAEQRNLLPFDAQEELQQQPPSPTPSQLQPVQQPQLQQPLTNTPQPRSYSWAQAQSDSTTEEPIDSKIAKKEAKKEAKREAKKRKENRKKKSKKHKKQKEITVIRARGQAIDEPTVALGLPNDGNEEAYPSSDDESEAEVDSSAETNVLDRNLTNTAGSAHECFEIPVTENRRLFFDEAEKLETTEETHTSGIDRFAQWSEPFARYYFGQAFKGLRAIINIVLALIFEILKFVLYIARQVVVETSTIFSNILFKPMLHTLFNNFCHPLLVIATQCSRGLKSIVRPCFEALMPCAACIKESLSGFKPVAINTNWSGSGKIHEIDEEAAIPGAIRV